jgi:hypothetical protein
MMFLTQFPEIYYTLEDDFSDADAFDELAEISADDDVFQAEEGYEQAFYGDNDEDA